MSASKLGAKKQRQAERAIGEPLLMAFAFSSGVIEGVTPDDRHYRWDRRPGGGVFGPIEGEDLCHWTTCPTSVQWRRDHDIPEELRP